MRKMFSFARHKHTFLHRMLFETFIYFFKALVLPKFQSTLKIEQINRAAVSLRCSVYQCREWASEASPCLPQFFASLTDLERFQSAHSLFCGFGEDKTVWQSVADKVWKFQALANISLFFNNSRKKDGQAILGKITMRQYNHYDHCRIIAVVLGKHMWQSSGLGPDSKWSKTVEV